MTDDFEEVCLVNDLGSEKTFIEPGGVTEIEFFYPGTTVSATFDTVTLTCTDGSTFTYMDVWEEGTET